MFYFCTRRNKEIGGPCFQDSTFMSTVTPGLADPTGLTGLMSKRLSDAMIIHILRKLELPDVLALRATSKRFDSLVSRLFR